jgi:hypothetical protein
MTPKDKAKELVLKYEKYFINIYTNYKAIKCALIAVDEIINTNPYEWDGQDLNSTIDYWGKVKKEIEAL